MNSLNQRRLDELRSDFKDVTGIVFNHFFCPFVYRDEDVPLCQAHIVNTAFPNSSRRWTIQRKDVDHFFGSVFEADFLAIRYHEGITPDQVLFSRVLSRNYHPRILRNGKPVKHFVAEGPLPPDFSEVLLERIGSQVRLGLKIHPSEFLASQDAIWEIEIAKDIRLAAMVSLLKAAHLTLFEMLGYRYALSEGGKFLGHTVLGEFFLKNVGLSKSDALSNADNHFRQFVHMVRPVPSPAVTLQGTTTDRVLYLCKAERAHPWAFIIFVRTSQLLHAVLAPVFEEPSGKARFLEFLESQNEQLEAYPCEYRDHQWLLAKKSLALTWPKTGVVYP